MSCWVVPAIAAELWGISLEQVVQAMKTGRVPSRNEFGFSLVDVAPNSPGSQPTARPKHLRPPTFAEPKPARKAVQAQVTKTTHPSIAMDNDEGDLTWLEIREQVSQLRRPPGKPCSATIGT